MPTTKPKNRFFASDYARAVAAATAILNRKDIQVRIANLVQDAERAITKAMSLIYLLKVVHSVRLLHN